MHTQFVMCAACAHLYNTLNGPSCSRTAACISSATLGSETAALITYSIRIYNN